MEALRVLARPRIWPAVVGMSAVWILAAYLAGSAVLGYAISLVRDLFARRPKTGKRGGPVHAGTAGWGRRPRASI